MTNAKFIDGAALATQLNATLREEVAAQAERQRPPRLAVVLVGDDYASNIYVQRKRKACMAVGIDSVDVKLAHNVSQATLAARIAALNADTDIDGILVQLPLPPHLVASDIIALIDVAKDVDGLHPTNQGLLNRNAALHVPCTPLGIMQLLRHSNCQLAGKVAAVVGRSMLVGMPISRLLMHAHATVINLHSRTAHPALLARQADVLVAAVGVPNLIDRTWIKHGATVIDVGINRTATGLVGDVNYAEACAVAAQITPVPGGVGPMTIAMLLRNTYNAAQRHRQA